MVLGLLCLINLALWKEKRVNELKRKVYKLKSSTKFMVEEKDKSVTNEQLEGILNEITSNLRDDFNSELNQVKVKGLSHFLGKTLYDLTGIVAGGALALSALGYTGMSFVYGPYDTGKVIYSEFSGDNSIKEKVFEEAKALYAKDFRLGELSEQDIDRLYRGLDVIPVSGEKQSLDKVSWNVLLDWVEDHRDNWYNPFN